MKLLGLQIPFTSKASALVGAESLSPVGGRGWMTIFESFTGAWQRNVTVNRDLVLSYHAVFSCMTLISRDIAKLPIQLLSRGDGEIWKTEENHPTFGPVLSRPNHYQNRIQFFERWMLSKLTCGNTYVLLGRDGSQRVSKMYILDPRRVTVLVTNEGDTYYSLNTDNIPGLETDVIVPSTEIIHDRFNCIYDDRIGVSPIFANGIASTQGLNIQNNSANFFGNRSQPGGVLVAPGKVDQKTLDEIKTNWNAAYSGENAGKIALLAEGVKFERLGLSAVDAQLIDQLRWTAVVVCGTFHVPPYKIAVGPMPAFNNIQSLNVEYYGQALQSHFEDLELCLREGLGLNKKIGGREFTVWFDTDQLLRMDTATQVQTYKDMIGSAQMAPNEARHKLDLPPKKGGDSLYLQQQNYSTEALAKRDAKDDPFAKAESKPPTEAGNDNNQEELEQELEETKALLAITKGFRT